MLFAWLTNRRHPWLGPFADDRARLAACEQVPWGYSFERPGSSDTWRGSRFEDPVTMLVAGRDPTEPVVLCLLEHDRTWH